MANFEQRVEERLISLEMARTESESGLEKRVEGSSKFIVAAASSSARTWEIRKTSLGSSEQWSQCRLHHHRRLMPMAQWGTASNIIFGISSWGRFPPTLRSRSTVHLSLGPTPMVLILLLSALKVLLGILLKSIRSVYLSYNFLCSRLRILSCGSPGVRTIMRYTGLRNLFGYVLRRCTWRVQRPAGFSQQSAASERRVGLHFVL
jgi:hypothetical protein